MRGEIKQSPERVSGVKQQRSIYACWSHLDSLSFESLIIFGIGIRLQVGGYYKFINMFNDGSNPDCNSCTHAINEKFVIKCFIAPTNLSMSMKLFTPINNTSRACDVRCIDRSAE